jgi:hypothetical protein
MGRNDVCNTIVSFDADRNLLHSCFSRPQFYLTFWSLSMSDLQVPEAAYNRRVIVLEQEMNQIDDRKDLVSYRLLLFFLCLYDEHGLETRSLICRRQQKNARKKKKYTLSLINSKKNCSNKRNMYNVYVHD